MKQFFTRFLMIGLLAALAPVAVHAQATRTWISGVGDDVNPCSRTAPGKTFAGAISKTAAGGEIDCLDPGGFGAVTVTKSMTLDGGSGQVASILASETNGITINAGLSDVVIIRNIRFQGIVQNGFGPGLSAIRVIQCGMVVIQHCEIDGFSVDGVQMDSGATSCNMSITDTRITNCTNDGVFVHGALGIHSSVTDCECEKCGNAGYEADTGVMTITRSVGSNGNTAFLATTGGAIHATHCTASGNTTAITAMPTSSVILNDCDIISNGTGISVGGGAVRSMGNNRFIGNSTLGTLTSTIAQM
jgi:hypothetical protein